MRGARAVTTLLVTAVALLTLTGSGTEPATAAEQAATIYWPNTAPGWNVPGLTEWTNTLTIDVQRPCDDCYVTSVMPDLQYDTGGGNWQKATYSVGAMLHHMVIFNHSYVDPTCAGAGIFANLGDRFFASGDERGTLAFPEGYGYRQPPANPSVTYWNLNVMIHNVGPSAKNFRLKVDFIYHPAADNLKAMRHLWLDENNCATSQYAVGSGYDDRHWDWTSGSAPGTADDMEGRIKMMGGHVHDWGVSVAATKGAGDTSPLICASRGGYAAGSPFAPATVLSPPLPTNAHPPDNIDLPGQPQYNGHIESMEGCSTNTMFQVGDTIRLHSQYVVPTPPGGVDDVMGIMGTWFYDNCWNVSNPKQDDIDVDDYGDVCDVDMDGDGLCNAGAQGEGGFSCSGTDTDDDNDGYDDIAESGAPVCLGSVNDDNNTTMGGTLADDSLVNDGCPVVGAAGESVCTGAVDEDADGAVNDGCAPSGAYAEGAFNIGTNVIARCHAGGVVNPSPSWPADTSSDGIPSSVDRVTLTDVLTFVAPNRRIGTSPGNPLFLSRFDLVPGRGVVADWINVSDILSLVNGNSGYPPMFDPDGPGPLPAARAFSGPTCTGP